MCQIEEAPFPLPTGPFVCFSRDKRQVTRVTLCSRGEILALANYLHESGCYFKERVQISFLFLHCHLFILLNKTKTKSDIISWYRFVSTHISFFHMMFLNLMVLKQSVFAQAALGPALTAIPAICRHWLGIAVIPKEFLP